MTRPVLKYVTVLFSLVLVLGGCGKSATPEPAAVAVPSDDELRQRIDRALDFTYANRHLNTKDQAAWQIVHGALCFGRDYQIYHEGNLVPAMDYLLAGGQLRGWDLRKGDHGLEAQLDPGSKTGQGHEDQWLGYLSQVGMPIDQTVMAGGQAFTVKDLITQAQWDIYDGMEATWTLMALSTYLPLDTEWTAKDGTTWNIPRIVSLEADQDLTESACGGAHRMYGITVAANRYRAAGGDFSGPGGESWRKADKKIKDAVAAAHANQGADGTLSANYFARPGTAADLATRLGAAGHVLEFLMISLDDEQIKEPWVTRAAASLVGNFEKTEKVDLECGALYHAAHGLALYRARRFGPWTPPRSQDSSQAAATDGAAVK